MIKVGTRGSTLALRQADEVINQLHTAYPGIYFQALAISTSGDGQAESPISKLGVGAFVKEIERSLLEGSIDLAVHSLKDLPTQLPDGLVLGAVLRREDPRDVLVNRWRCPLSQVPTGARIGTGSPRREAQLKHLRPDLQVLPIRGNVETRINKTLGLDYDGAVLAAAGMIRLGLEDKISEFFPYNDFVPAPGQGALAVEVRQDDADILKMVSAIDHLPTKQEVTCERAFLAELGGGCRLPVGSYAVSQSNGMELTVFLAPVDAAAVFRATVYGRTHAPQELAQDAYKQITELGAGVLLADSPASPGSDKGPSRAP